MKATMEEVFEMLQDKIKLDDFYDDEITRAQNFLTDTMFVKEASKEREQYKTALEKLYDARKENRKYIDALERAYYKLEWNIEI